MPIGPARMPLLDHLGELRRRVVIIVVCFLIAVVALYSIADQLINFLKQPIAEFLPEGDIYTTGAFEGFTLKFAVSAYAALVVTSPIIFWELFAFFLPALRPNERKYVLPTFFIAVALFIVGMVFCYSFCLGAAFEWLTGEAKGFSTLLPSASDYIHYVILFEIAFGIAFELPLVIFFLVLFNIVPYKKLRKSWRIVYIALMILSAVVTPDASPVTMLIMFAALVALYEIALAIARVALAKKIKRQQEEEAAEEAEWDS